MNAKSKPFNHMAKKVSESNRIFEIRTVTTCSRYSLLLFKLFVSYLYNYLSGKRRSISLCRSMKLTWERFWRLQDVARKNDTLNKNYSIT